MVSKNTLAFLLVATAVVAGVTAVGDPGGVLGDPTPTTPTGMPTTSEDAEAPTGSPTAAHTSGATSTPPATSSAAGSSTPAGVATPTATPLPTATGGAEVVGVDEAAVVAAVEARIGSYRDDPRTQEDEALVTDSGTARALARIAESHSDAMAAERRVAHTVDGVTAADRYARYPETDGCRLTDDNDNYVADRTEYEALYVTSVDGRDGAELGTAIADGMLADDDARRTLTFEDARAMGVGLNVTGGRAYVTVAVC